VKLIPPLLAAKIRDFLIIKAHAIGPRQLAVALEAYVHETKKAATAIVTVDLDTLATTLVCEVAGWSLDYLHAHGWHGLLQRDAVIELEGTQRPVVTKAKLGKSKGVYAPALTALARLADTTYVAGTKLHEGLATNGFVAKVQRGSLVDVFDTAARGELGPITALCAGDKHLHAGGGWIQATSCPAVYRGNGVTFGAGVPITGNEIRSLYEKADRSLMVGLKGGEAALVVDGRPPRPLTGGAMLFDGVTEFRGVEYWMSTDGHDDLRIYKRSNAKLAKAFKAKAQWAGYRNLHGTPNARMTSSTDLLVVSNVDRLHVYDGKTWSQLGLRPNLDQPFKRLPTGMKR
jgi:hypothetical protein